jgi:hypothetical protein
MAMVNLQWARRLRALACLALSLLVALPATALTEAKPLTEYQVKAAFLYNFTKFVEWPENAFKDAGSPMVVGLLGKDPFGPMIDRMLSGNTVQDRPIILKRIQNPDDAKDCHVLFISRSEAVHMAEIAAALHNSPVLTVGDREDFVSLGAIIGFLKEQNKIKFSINQVAAEAAGLKISSQILKLAKAVEGGAVQGDK